MSERNQSIASYQAQQQSAMSSQEDLPAYAEATDGNAVPPYSDGRQSRKSQPKQSKMDTFKKIVKGDAHNNHMAALELAASSSGVPSQPKKDKSANQSSFKKIIKGDAHSNHLAALKAAASSSGIPPQPAQDRSDKQSQNSGRTPTWKLIATGEVHKYNPRFRLAENL